MKRFILISGIFFYFISASITVMATFFFSDAGKPDSAFVPNYRTGATVWQPHMEAFDAYALARHTAYTKPELHNTEAPADGADMKVQQAWGTYWARLHDDKPASVSRGDAAYTEAVCWHCHSQFVRPMAYENYRWGPTSFIGESAHENPTRFGTRRIGPDLTREGGMRSDDWHYAHFDHPKYTVPQSIMAPYGGIQRYWHKVSTAALNTAQTEMYDAINTLHANDKDSDKVARGEGLFNLLTNKMAEYADNGTKAWLLFKGRENGLDPTSKPVVRVTKMPNERITALVAYVQTRGIGIGITKETDDKFRMGGSSQTGPAVDNPDWLNYVRKLDFNAGNWRIQAPAARPLSRPSYVQAPAEFLEERRKAEEVAAAATGQFYEDGSPILNKNVPEYRRYEAYMKDYDLSLRRGVNLFLKKCSGCHGGMEANGDAMPFDLAQRGSLKLIGNGYGPAADYLVPEPRNFHLSAWDERVPAGEGESERVLMPRERGSNAVEYKNRSGDPEPGNKLARPEDLFHTIRNGMMPSSMPAWPFLRDQEIWDLVNFIMLLGRPDAEVERVIKIAEESQLELSPAAALQQVASYWNLSAVRTAFSAGPSMPVLRKKPSSAAILDRPFTSLTPAEKEDFAAAYWAQKLGIALDGNAWSPADLAKVGEAVFTGELNGAKVTRVNNQIIPECAQCHGRDGDGWGSRRGEMLSTIGFPARNYYNGQFKLGASHDGIWRAMRYGILNSPMNAQIDDNWTAVEALGLAEFVLSKRDEGVYGIKPTK